MSIEQAVADLAKIEQQASQLRTYIDVARKYAKARSEEGTVEPTSTAASTFDTSNGRSMSRRITDMAVGLIRATGRPISTRDLLAQMEQQGLIVGGQNRAATLSNLLSRDKKRQVTSCRLGWRLVEWSGDTPPDNPPKKADATPGR